VKEMKQVKNDLTGKRFGRLTVIGVDDKQSRKTYYICKCDCGNIKTIRSDALVAGKTTSCGCRKKEQDEVNLARNTHNMSDTRLHSIWVGIKSRCNNIHNPRYHRYGGRGIKVCDEWNNDFISFYEWSINNGYQDDLTIDRIDNDKGYEPSNCRWVDMKTQCRNRETNINITIGKSTRTLTEWCEIFNLDTRVIFARYNRNGFIGINELFNQC
jgi:hypothetical protein